MAEMVLARVSPKGRVAFRMAEPFRGNGWLMAYVPDEGLGGSVLNARFQVLTDAEVTDWTPLVDAAALAERWEKDARSIAVDGFVPLHIRDKGTPEDAAQWREQTKAQAYGMEWCAGELRRAMEGGQ